MEELMNSTDMDDTLGSVTKRVVRNMIEDAEGCGAIWWTDGLDTPGWEIRTGIFHAPAGWMAVELCETTGQIDIRVCTTEGEAADAAVAFIATAEQQIADASSAYDGVAW
jgi:hypothetical protein